MAQLLKRTKKSCIKFFRKLTSSTKPSSASAKLEETSLSSCQTPKCVSHEKDISSCDIPLRCPYALRSKMAQNQNKSKINAQHQNYRSSQADTKKSTNFIVYSNYANKLDSYLTNARQTINPSISLSSDVKGVKSFRLLNEDDVPYVDDDMPTRRNPSEIVFEKVRYRDNVRYFRRTPSNCSLSSHPSSPKTVQAFRECSCDLSEGRKVEYNSRAAYTQARQSNIYLQFRNNISHPVNLTLTSNAAGNLNNLVISEGRNWLNEPCPIVTWDINGNSIDDDITCLNNNWDDCDNRLNMLRDKRLMRTRDGSYKSSTRSSSTTLETWVDDEVLDNSFNEELERHFGI